MPNKIEAIEINSSVIKGASYNRSESILTLLFNSGKEYEYIVPGDLWTAFKNSESKGRFFNSVIKGKFKLEKIN